METHKDTGFAGGANTNWLSLRGSLKSEWNRLTDDDLDFINGRLNELEGRLQNRYGWERQETRDAVNRFLKTVRVSLRETR